MTTARGEDQMDSINAVVLDAVCVRAHALAEELAASHGIRARALVRPADLSAEGGADVVVVHDHASADGLAAVRSVRSALPESRILLLATAADHALLSEAIGEGADGFLTVSDAVADVAEAIRLLTGGAAVIPPHMLGTLLRELVQESARAEKAAQLFAALTPREREVLELLVEGCDHHAAAQRLFIAPETAKSHIQNTITKLGVHSRLAAAALAVEYGLVPRSERQT